MIEDDIKKVTSPILKEAASLLVDAAYKITAGECREDEITEIVARVHPQRNGYINKEKLRNVDKCCEILGLGYNRNKFYEIIKPYHIKQEKINNHSCGYNIDDILRIKKDLYGKAEIRI